MGTNDKFMFNGHTKLSMFKPDGARKPYNIFTTPGYRSINHYTPGSIGSDGATPESDSYTPESSDRTDMSDTLNSLDFGSACEKETPKRMKRTSWIRSRVENFKRQCVMLENDRNEIESVPDAFRRKLQICESSERPSKRQRISSPKYDLICDEICLQQTLRPNFASPQLEPIKEIDVKSRKRLSDETIENCNKKFKPSPKVRNNAKYDVTPKKFRLSPKKVSPKKLSIGKSLHFTDKILNTIRRHDLLYDSPREEYLPVKKVDFLVKFGIKRNLGTIVDNIFSYLTSSELYSCSLVSKNWQFLCNSNTKVNRKIKNFISIWKTTKENPPIRNEQKARLPEVPAPNNESTLKTKKPLTSRKENQSTAPVLPTSPPVSPGKRKFQVYVKEGQKLNKGETLLPCPKCTFPSRVNTSVTTAQCTSPSCSYNFCTKCLFLAQNDVHCCDFVVPGSPSPNKIKQITIGSKQSRKALRRL